MRENYNTIDDFKKEYTGIRNPSEEKWYGLEFCYNKKYYRFDYIDNIINFYFLKIGIGKLYPDIDESIFIESYTNIDDALCNIIIDGNQLKEILISDEVNIVGKD